VDSKAFGQFIARTRKEKNMTQADLASIIGVTDKAVSRWERGIGFPDINTLEPLSSALDISVLELMRLIGVDSFVLAWGLYCVFSIVVGIINR
jgi:transcriptional regulator with XRE-family HTH domain